MVVLDPPLGRVQQIPEAFFLAPVSAEELRLSVPRFSTSGS
jgi:hypothetical protein